MYTIFNFTKSFIKVLIHNMSGRRTLTKKEVETLNLIARGLKVKMVAYELGVSQSMITQRLKNILQKLGATNTTHAVAIAIVKGIVTLSIDDEN